MLLFKSYFDLVVNLQLCDWKSTLDASNDALNLNAGNTKALFRRANAYANLNFIEEAIGALNMAHQIDPNDEVGSRSFC